MLLLPESHFKFKRCSLLLIISKWKHLSHLGSVLSYPSGNCLSQDGGQLLSLPVLLLPDQPSESEGHVWPPQLPTGEQQRGPRWVQPCLEQECSGLHICVTSEKSSGLIPVLWQKVISDISVLFKCRLTLFILVNTRVNRINEGVIYKI